MFLRRRSRQHAVAAGVRHLSRGRTNVRYCSNSGQTRVGIDCPLSARSGYGQCKLKQADAPQFPVGRRQKRCVRWFDCPD